MKKLTHKQQLRLIEGLCTIWEGSSKEQPDNLISNIFRIAHLNGTCKNPHLAWHIEGHGLGKALIKQRIIDYKKDK